MTATATVRTPLAHPALVAAAVRPDNTEQIRTRVEDGAVVTTVERDDVAGLRATLDDYVVNLAVADRVVDVADAHRRTEREVPGEDVTRTDSEAPTDEPTDTPDTP